MSQRISKFNIQNKQINIECQWEFLWDHVQILTVPKMQENKIWEMP